MGSLEHVSRAFPFHESLAKQTHLRLVLFGCQADMWERLESEIEVVLQSFVSEILWFLDTIPDPVEVCCEGIGQAFKWNTTAVILDKEDYLWRLI